ncbi:YkgJ family cysteine cluster protein [Desulfovibrio inopinatus]|uniref:YkgJ family cysteine cluster protein n=1 Tax=Desulfovibrio inopinatus TaxID=102109 RepID=UPI0003F86FA2|nr:YkgJ family cysteine cluster protein [Desulfovibrio inopinatus]
MEMSLSVLEKFMLKMGFQVGDIVDRTSGRITCRATAPNGWSVDYPSPLYVYPEMDRRAETRALFERLAAWLGETNLEALTTSIITTCITSIEGFVCKNCGRCCTKVIDAYQGRVSPEELAEWIALGNKRVFRLVQKLDRPDYSLYRAFVNPKTQRYFPRCPFYGKTREGLMGCRIHAHKPLKCRAYPYNRLAAEYAGCRGFEHLELEADCVVTDIQTTCLK